MNQTNALTSCFCGSGKHYRDCHGALQGSDVALDTAIDLFMQRNPRVVHVAPSRVEGSLQGRSLVFVHIPKSAGITLNWILYSIAVRFHAVFFRALGTVYGQYMGEGKGEAGDYLRQADPGTVMSASILDGHVPVSIWERVIGARRAAYVTILRDPVERMISNYLHGVSRNGWSADTGMKSLVQSGRLVDNLQVRMLAGCTDARQPCSETMLETAYTKLRRRFALVGVIDRFDAFLAALLGLYGWPDIVYAARNVTAIRVAPERQAALRAEASDYNAFDARLLARVREHGDVWLNGVDASPPQRLSTDLLMILDASSEFLCLPRDELPKLDDFARRANCQLVHA